MTFFKSKVGTLALFGLTLLSTPVSHASSFSLLLDEGQGTPLTASQRGAMQGFLKELEHTLPERLKAAISAPVVLRLLPEGKSNHVAPPQCAIGEDETLVPPAKNDVLLGKYLRSSNPRNADRHVIAMNRGFIAEIERGLDRSTPYPCGHKNLYRLALATVAHEIAHVYDAMNTPAFEDVQERNERKRCAKLAASSKGSGHLQDSSCNSLATIQTTVSDRPTFQRLMDWKRGSFGTSSKNILHTQDPKHPRSPDVYEYSNPLESFAVNMEFFLLDPEYACRRPALHAFLSDHFGYRPFPEGSCQLNTQVRFHSSKMNVSLDPSRIYEVHYLVAAKGEELSSRWGHAMFRLITCAPERKEAGPDCLKDIQHHVVLSYRANVSDVILSTYKGLVGKYPSQLFLLAMPEIISEYNIGQSRDVISVPIKLNRKQVEGVAYRALEQYWAYQGRYYFLGNNCATESMNFLQGLIPDAELQETKHLITTPMKLYELLSRLGLLDESVLKREDAQSRYFFSGFYRQARESFALIQEASGLGSKLTFERYVQEYGAQDRRKLYEQIIQNFSQGSLGGKSKIAVQFLFMELRIREHINVLLGKRLGKVVEEESASKAAAPGSLAALAKKSIELGQLTNSWSTASAGYGVPLPGEVLSDEKFNGILKELNTLMLQMKDQIKANAKDVISDLNAVSENIKFFMSEVKKDMKKAPLSGAKPQ